MSRAVDGSYLSVVGDDGHEPQVVEDGGGGLGRATTHGNDDPL